MEDFKYELVVALPKKKGTMKCEEHIIINLTSHAFKIIWRVIKIRLESKIDSNLENDQFGFRKNIGTREGILSLRILIEKQIRVNKDIFYSFC